jgi:hypothetical protein
MRDKLIEIGDIYFIVAKFIPSDEFSPYVTEVEIILKFRNKYIARQVENDCKWYSIKRSDFGKTVFLTKEEAEEKLKEMKDNG